MDRRGEEVENWQDDNRLILIYRPEDTPTFYSRRWHTTSSTDLALCTEDVHKDPTREVGEQLGGSDHRPVFLTIDKNAITNPVQPRWNFKKAEDIEAPQQAGFRQFHSTEEQATYLSQQIGAEASPSNLG
nr:hypothetical protein BaRGS_019699 [Batillaria attramentaria]KAG5698849.1 hypothetical protein BaRGS_019701 [Batillaria attramentaria]